MTGFRTFPVPGGSAQVGFDFAPDAVPAGAGLARRLAGVQGGLPDTYGLNPDELAELLNRWRATYSSTREAPT